MNRLRIVSLATIAILALGAATVEAGELSVELRKAQDPQPATRSSLDRQGTDPVGGIGTYLLGASIGQPIINGFVGFETEIAILNGVWHKFGEPQVVSVSPTTPEHKLQLRQNYPNPFRNQTTIPFTVSREGPVKLSVYDISGRSVATLIDRTIDAGEYNAVLTAHAFPPGLYFYRLQAEGKTLTRKLLLLQGRPSAAK